MGDTGDFLLLGEKLDEHVPEALRLVAGGPEAAVRQEEGRQESPVGVGEVEH